jgi:hypothetical protein
MSIKKSLNVFICKILANMIKVSDVAPGPLVTCTIIIDIATLLLSDIYRSRCEIIVQVNLEAIFILQKDIEHDIH